MIKVTSVFLKPVVLIMVFCITAAWTFKPQKKDRIPVDIYLPQQNDTLIWKKEAEKMVSSQIVARGIRDKGVIGAMKNTPRHLFVPAGMAIHAYTDSPLPIGEGQTISQPYIVALMTELLQLTGNEKVLEIGTGSGYQAAILSPLVDTCYTIELIKPLANTADSILRKLQYKNIIVKQGDGYQGWVEHAPFDRIIITAAPEEIPQKLVEQLKPGGSMVVPVGKNYQELLLIKKTRKGKIYQEKILPVSFVPMVKPQSNENIFIMPIKSKYD